MPPERFSLSGKQAMHPAVAAYPITLSVVAAGLLPRSDILGVESVREGEFLKQEITEEF